MNIGLLLENSIEGCLSFHIYWSLNYFRLSLCVSIFQTLSQHFVVAILTYASLLTTLFNFCHMHNQRIPLEKWKMAILHWYSWYKSHTDILKELNNNYCTLITTVTACLTFCWNVIHQFYMVKLFSSKRF